MTLHTLPRLVLGLILLVGCSTAPTGGGVSSDERFSIHVDESRTHARQGDHLTATFSLDRGPNFKRDVDLELRASDGITVDPTSLRVKSSDSGNVMVKVLVPADAALGEYRVYIKGTPERGEATTTEFTIIVASP